MMSKTNPSMKRIHGIVTHIRLIDIMTALSIVIIAAYLLISFYFPFKTLQVTNLEDGRIPVITEQVPAGGFLKYRVVEERYTDKTATVIRNLVNGQNIALSASLSNRPTGTTEFIGEVQIPENTNPGIYHLRITIEFEYPLDRTIRHVLQTQEFRIVEPGGEYIPPEEAEPPIDSSAPPGIEQGSPSRQVEQSYTPSFKESQEHETTSGDEQSQTEETTDETETVPPRNPIVCLPLTSICIYDSF